MKRVIGMGVQILTVAARGEAWRRGNSGNHSQG
jgi:hypothetical protein